MKKKIRSGIAALLIAATVFLSAVVGGSAQTPRYRALTADDALTASGENLVNKKGEKVFLRGVNLGGWLIQEDWFCPAYNNAQGDYHTLQTLTSRFGTKKAYELYNIFQDAWIQETDFMNIADMGFNCVRIPFWYRNFQSDDNGTWITDIDGKIDLSRLEWAVEMCGKYGLYAVLDLHGVNGCQGMQDHCGQKNNYRFFDQNNAGKEYRRQAIELWEVIAERFVGNPAVAMFDLLNEPMCDVPLLKRRHAYINEFYDDAYHAIRKIDPDRTICMIGTWDISKLPDPASKNWTNVVYQYHEYDLTLTMYKNTVNNAKRQGYNVPIFAGEFHPTSKENTPDPATLADVINLYNNNNIMWALWTYKGYNSWAAWADWFAYGSVKDELIVRPETDSYEEIARKWGQMGTNSGNFYKGHLFDVAYPYLPDALSASTPFNKPEDIPPDADKPDVPPVTPPEEQPTTPPSGNPQPDQPLAFTESAWKISDDRICIPADRITPERFRAAANKTVTLSSLAASNKYICTGTVVTCVDAKYTVILRMDCNCDGIVNSSDARTALRAAARIIPLNAAEAAAADADGNSKVSAADARLILRRCAKLDPA